VESVVQVAKRNAKKYLKHQADFPYTDFAVGDCRGGIKRINQLDKSVLAFCPKNIF